MLFRLTLLLLFFGFASLGYGHGAHRKKFKHMHGSGGKTSDFTLGLGASYTTLFDKSESDSKTSKNSDGSGTSQTLHGGEDHGGGGGGGGSEGGDEHGGSNGSEVEFSLVAGYRPVKRWNLTAAFGYAPSAGVLDPSAAVGYQLQSMRNIKQEISFSMTAPISKSSRDAFRITKTTLAYKPTFSRNTWFARNSISMSNNWYSKTVIVEEEMVNRNDQKSSDNPKMLHGDEEGGDDGHDDGHDDLGGEVVGTGDREFNRYNVATLVGKKVLKGLSFGSGISGALITYQFGPKQYEVTATIIQADYRFKRADVVLALFTTEQDTTLKMPTAFGGSGALNYTFF